MEEVVVDVPLAWRRGCSAVEIPPRLLRSRAVHHHQRDPHIQFVPEEGGRRNHLVREVEDRRSHRTVVAVAAAVVGEVHRIHQRDHHSPGPLEVPVEQERE